MTQIGHTTLRRTHLRGAIVPIPLKLDPRIDGDKTLEVLYLLHDEVVAVAVEDHGPTIHDRDTKFAAGFDRISASVGVETILTPVRSPKANPFAEHWVRTSREERLDHLLVFSRRHQERSSASTSRKPSGARPESTASNPVVAPARLAGLSGRSEIASFRCRQRVTGR